MRGHRDDDVSERSGVPGREHGSRSSPLRTIGMIGGFLLAAAATAAVFLTEDPQYLRLAVVAVAWAFVLAAFLAGRRRAEAQAAAGREAEIRRSYEDELDREAAAHREHELQLETDLRRETEQSMRAELIGLRREVAGFSGLREELAQMSGLREDVARMSALRDDLASLAALRSDVASIAALREDLASLAELRADMGRLRAELSEQLNGEMLIERIMLRTQSVRTPSDLAPADVPRTAEAPATWEDGRPPRELTGGWPAVRLDELPETRQAEPVRVDRPAGPPPGRHETAASMPSRPSWEAPGTAGFARAALSTPPPPAPPPVRPAPAPARPAAARPTTPPPPPTPPPTPLEWLADRSLVTPEDLAPRRSRHAAAEPDDAVPAHARAGVVPAGLLPPVPPRRRRTDKPADDRTTERPATPVTAREPIVRPAPPAPLPVRETQTPGHQRLEQILADGQPPPSGGRRRRRYRDEDDPDDVLARVLRQN